MGFGIRARPTTPLISIKRLAEIGMRRVTLPHMLPAAAIRGMTCALEVMKPADRPVLLVHKPFAFRRGRYAFGRRQTR
jgi:2-methylisocitrate lyase-like PEP mutase family enzyme